MNAPVQIPLRSKYLRVANGRFSGGERPAARKHRHKIGHDAHVKRFGEPPLYTRWVDARGHASMRRVA